MAHEPLDFLFPYPSGTVGVEITELCHEHDRREGARLGYVAPKAKRAYTRKPDARPVSVSPVFSPDAHGIGVDVLASGLASFVYAHRYEYGSFSWGEDDSFPAGFCHIAVFEPAEWEPQGEWRYFRGFETHRASKSTLDCRIAVKNARIADYRVIANEVWLLIVSDLFLGPGEVSVRDEDLAKWRFDHAFDKVLLFERQPGGSGKVFELHAQ